MMQTDRLTRRTDTHQGTDLQGDRTTVVEGSRCAVGIPVGRGREGAAILAKGHRRNEPERKDGSAGRARATNPLDQRVTSGLTRTDDHDERHNIM